MYAERYTTLALLTKESECSNINIRADFRARKIVRDKEGHYIIIKRDII